MVSNSRGTSDTRRIRRLKSPQPLEVETTDIGAPVRLRLGRQWREVSLVRMPWRVDQYWWRGDGISRLYFQVAPPESLPVTIYEDLVGKQWYLQDYA